MIVYCADLTQPNMPASTGRTRQTWNGASSCLWKHLTVEMTMRSTFYLVKHPTVSQLFLNPTVFQLFLTLPVSHAARLVLSFVHAAKLKGNLWGWGWVDKKANLQLKGRAVLKALLKAARHNPDLTDPKTIPQAHWLYDISPLEKQYQEVVASKESGVQVISRPVCRAPAAHLQSQHA